MLYIARMIVRDRPLTWQKSQTRLTPQRVQQGFLLIFAQIGSPARASKVRGNPQFGSKVDADRRKTFSGGQKVAFTRNIAEIRLLCAVFQPRPCIGLITFAIYDF